MKQRLVMVAVLVLVAGAFVLAQPPQTPPATPDGFVPVNSLPQAEQLPAAPMVIAAYSVVWVVLIGYIWMLWRRLSKVERELADLTRRVQNR
jgi:CcmD family protein